MKILIVEDERRVGQFIERALQEQSHATQVVSTCRDARDALAASACDAIILDLGLPDGDGLDLLQEPASKLQWDGLNPQPLGETDPRWNLKRVKNG